MACVRAAVARPTACTHRQDRERTEGDMCRWKFARAHRTLVEAAVCATAQSAQWPFVTHDEKCAPRASA
jgi:hypothetical protein